MLLALVHMAQVLLLAPPSLQHKHMHILWVPSNPATIKGRCPACAVLRNCTAAHMAVQRPSTAFHAPVCLP